MKRALKNKGIDVHSEIGYDHSAGVYVFDNNGTMVIGEHMLLNYVVDENSGDTTLGTLYSTAWNKLSRRTINAVVFEFDRMVIRSIIASGAEEKLTDDIMNLFTVAQITELVDFSAKCGSVSCTARILDYKNKRFSEYDPFDMFVLE